MNQVLEYPASYRCTSCGAKGSDLFGKPVQMGEEVPGCPNSDEPCADAHSVIVSVGSPGTALDGYGNPVRA